MLRSVIVSAARGFAMGTVEVLPGFSGGTVALVLGIYERLIASVSAGSKALGALVKLDFSSFKSWLGKVDWWFIIPLLVGILVAALSLVHLISTLLDEQPIPMAALMIGLVTGSLVVAWRMIRRPTSTHVWIALAVAVVTLTVVLLTSGSSGESGTQVAQPALWAFFISGALAICAWIVPGISGAFILILLGMYGPLLDAITERDLVPIGVFMIGAVLGLAVFSQFLNWVLAKHHDIVLAAMVGLMAGSLRVLWPWPDGVESETFGAPDSYVGIAIVMTIIGFAAVLALAWISRRVEPTREPAPVTE